MMKIRLLYFGVLIWGFQSCDSNFSVLEYKDCRNKLVSRAKINKSGLLNGKAEYFFLDEDYSVIWSSDTTGNFTFSTISNWEKTDDGKDFLYNAIGKVHNEEGQILFWKNRAKLSELDDLIEEPEKLWKKSIIQSN